MASRARRVKGDDPDQKGYPGPPGWGLGMRLITSSRKKYVCWETSKIGNRMETTNMTQHEQGFISGNVEYACLCIEVVHCITWWKKHDHRVDLLAVQEVGWLGRSVIEKGCAMYYSCDDEHIFGAGFIVSKHIRSRVIFLNPLIWDCGYLELEANLKITVSSVPTYAQRERGRESERQED
jgi:hypothetical protein